MNGIEKPAAQRIHEETLELIRQNPRLGYNEAFEILRQERVGGGLGGGGGLAGVMPGLGGQQIQFPPKTTLPQIASLYQQQAGLPSGESLTRQAEIERLGGTARLASELFRGGMAGRGGWASPMMAFVGSAATGRATRKASQLKREIGEEQVSAKKKGFEATIKALSSQRQNIDVYKNQVRELIGRLFDDNPDDDEGVLNQLAVLQQQVQTDLGDDLGIGKTIQQWFKLHPEYTASPRRKLELKTLEGGKWTAKEKEWYEKFGRRTASWEEVKEEIMREPVEELKKQYETLPEKK